MGNIPSSDAERREHAPLTDDDFDRIRTAHNGRHVALDRRSTIPIELEDPEDCTVGEPGFPPPAHHYDEDFHSKSIKAHGSTTFTDELLKLPREVRNILAGGIAGIVAKSVVAPIDRIKILYQVSAAHFHLSDIPLVVRNIIRDEGFSALWKGNMATLIRVFPYSGIQFMVYDRCKRYFLQEHGNRSQPQQTILPDAPSTTTTTTTTTPATPAPEDRHDRKWGLTPLESLGAGMVAGIVSVVCTYPLDLARAQLAVLKHNRASHNRGFVGILGDNHRRGGFAGLFRGISPTLLGILPYSGIAFALNEQAKREIQHLTGREVTTVERMQCGALSGLVAQTVTYPIEVTRRRMQTIGLVGNRNDTALTSLGCSSQRPVVTSPPTLLSTIRNLYAEQGIRGFLKGVSMNWMKGPVAFSISFTTFDHVQKLLESPMERSQRLPRAEPEAIRRDS